MNLVMLAVILYPECSQGGSCFLDRFVILCFDFEEIPSNLWRSEIRVCHLRRRTAMLRNALLPGAVIALALAVEACANVQDATG
jgi:hypothetical protein